MRVIHVSVRVAPVRGALSHGGLLKVFIRSVVVFCRQIRQLYALLPRYLVARYVRMCPVCAHSAGSSKGPKVKKLKTSGTPNSTQVVTVSVPVVYFVHYTVCGHCR